MDNTIKNYDEWYLPEWNYFVDELSSIFRLTAEEKKQLNNSFTAKIIATIPFAANCIEPERTAILHLCIYLAELKGVQKYFAHLPSDDVNIYNRLACISTFEGGDEKTIQHGLDLLAFIMIEGYQKNKTKDVINNVYNPFVSGRWNYKNLKNEINMKINKMHIPSLDSLFYSMPEAIWR